MVICATLSGAQTAVVDYKIVTASERGTYIQIGRDLAKFVAPEADIELEVLPSAGSAENVQRLRYDPASSSRWSSPTSTRRFSTRPRAGNAEAGALIRPLRVIMPLYNEEIYFVVRADSPLQLRPRDQGPADQRRAAAQRHGDVGDDDLPADVRPAHRRAQRQLSSPTRTRSSSSIGDKSDRRGGHRRGPARQAAGRHEARGAAAHQAAEVRPRPSGEPRRR